MNILDFKTKTIVFCAFFLVLTVIGLFVDDFRDRKNSTRYGRYDIAHNSNCGPPLVFFGSIIVIWILSML